MSRLLTYTVDPQLARPQVFSHLDYLDQVITIQLKCFAYNVHFIREFEWL